MHCNLQTASHSGMFMANFVLRTRRNCSFRASFKIQTPSFDKTTPISCKLRIFWRLVDIHHVIFDLLTLNMCNMLGLRTGIFFTMFEVPQPICFWLLTCYYWYVTSMGNVKGQGHTMTFDAMTLNVCTVSAVTCSNSVPNLSKIEKIHGWIWPKVNFHNSVAPEDPYRTSLSNFTITGREELLIIQPIFTAPFLRWQHCSPHF